MFVKQPGKGLELDRFLTSIPYIFAYAIFIMEEDQYQRFAVSLAVCLICLIVVIFKNINHMYANNSYAICISRVLVVGVLFSFSLYNFFYFIVGLASIAIVIYKIFEFLGDFVERILVEKVEMELSMALILKYCCWLGGFLAFIVSFFWFIVRFANLYQNHSITLLLMKTDIGIIAWISAIIISMINAVFILDFLIKWIIHSFNQITFNVINRTQIQLMFIKMVVIIVFADITYSLLYLAFSGMKIEEINSQADYILIFQNYFKSFYYAFCLHFSATLPTTPFFIEMDNAVKQTFSLQIIQFFHFCLNKITDITVLAYTAGVILKALGITKNKSI